jgi:sec-independent protein translocase protein TatA
LIPNIGPTEIAIVLAIALVVFGPKRLPELGRSIGGGLRELRHSASVDHNEALSDEVDDPNARN